MTSWALLAFVVAEAHSYSIHHLVRFSSFITTPACHLSGSLQLLNNLWEILP